MTDGFIHSRDKARLTGTPTRAETWTVLASCTALSLAAIVWSWRHHALLNYGDAIAHLHIARRIFDSRFPGITELGSVWLPLPHLLMLPFVQVYAWWANGLAGTIPSALAWIAACMGFYLLARRWMPKFPAALALAFFALNPNLLYLQTTAMTEPLFVAEMIWIVLALVAWHTSLDAGLDASPRRTRRLEVCIALLLLAAIYTRYDGWILTLIAWSAMGIVLLRRNRLRARAFWICSAVLIAAPLAWFAYNHFAFGDWLSFARGPYSAKAIELRTAHGSGPPHPGWHNPWVGLLFYLKVSQMDAFAICTRAALAFSVLGTVGAWLALRRRTLCWAWLLWLPVPFYAYSVAYGSVPIFIPVWWPHSWYNTRYGVELLPALALGLGFIAQFVLMPIRELKARWPRYAAAALFIPVALNAWGLVCERPLVYVEGTLNLRARLPFDRDIPPALRAELARCPGSTVLMNTSVYPELVALTGIPLRQTINESDRWIYRDALAAPAGYANLVLAFDGDEIDRAVEAHPAGLRAVAHFTAPNEPSATLYISPRYCSGAAAGSRLSPR